MKNNRSILSFYSILVFFVILVALMISARPILAGTIITNHYEFLNNDYANQFPYYFTCDNNGQILLFLADHGADFQTVKYLIDNKELEILDSNSYMDNPYRNYAYRLQYAYANAGMHTLTITYDSPYNENNTGIHILCLTGLPVNINFKLDYSQNRNGCVTGYTDFASPNFYLVARVLNGGGPWNYTREYSIEPSNNATVASSTIQNYSYSALFGYNASSTHFLVHNLAPVNEACYEDNDWLWQGNEWRFSYYATSTTAISPEFTAIINQCDHICDDIASSTILGLIDISAIECGLRKTLCKAVIPTQATITDFNTNFDNFKRSTPFNIYYDLMDTVTTGIDTASTTLTSDGTVGIPFIRASSTAISKSEYYILPVLASTSIPNLIGSNNNDYLRLTISYLFWIATAFLCFLEIKPRK
jgi:hypothetical protein